MSHGVDFHTEVEVARVIDARLRRSVLATLASPITSIPPTSGGHDILLPFWWRGQERPSDQKALAATRPAPVLPDTQFLPSEIRGGPSTLGTGYLVIELQAGRAATVEPGLVSEQETALDLFGWFYVPEDGYRTLMPTYTAAFAELWRRVDLMRSIFEPHFDPGRGIQSIRQRDPISAPEAQGRAGEYMVHLQRIPLRRLETVVGNPTAPAP